MFGPVCFRHVCFSLDLLCVLNGLEVLYSFTSHSLRYFLCFCWILHLTFLAAVSWDTTLHAGWKKSAQASLCQLFCTHKTS